MIRGYIFYLSLIATAITVVSCDAVNVDLPEKAHGIFSASIIQNYSIEIASKSSETKTWQASGKRISATITEEPWNTGIDVRSSVTGDEIEWVDSARVGLFLENAANSAIVGFNIPINPLTHEIYKSRTDGYKYYEKKYLLNPPDTLTNRELGIVEHTDFFWNNLQKLPDKVNFYGFYPRPFDFIHDWEYLRSSVVSTISTASTTEWNLLKYDFWTDQTDENMNQFDLMYSISSQAITNIPNSYGNQGKGQTDNVHLPFIHAFSLLDFTIDKGSYTGDFKVSSISISGTKVTKSGTIDIKNGTLTETMSTGGQTIKRLLSSENEGTTTVRTAMIVPPISSSSEIDITCTIDGADYACSFSKMSITSGKRYSVKLKIVPDGLVIMRIWDGATVTIGNKTYEGPGEFELESNYAKEKSFIVSNKNSDFSISKVTKNNIILNSKNGNDEYALEQSDGANTYYSVVSTPTTSWYSHPDKMRTFFDGIWNSFTSSYDEQDKDSQLWVDRSGNGNDGKLENFSSPYGWTGKGLKFNGTTSIVKFPGKINSTAYSMEFLIFMEENQKTSGTPRIIAEGTDFPAYYFRKQNGTNQWKVGLYGHGAGRVNDFNYIVNFGKMMQIDVVYSNHKVTVYLDGQEIASSPSTLVNAKSIQEASIGRRITDYTRALTGTYYSVILYDVPLTNEEINQNLTVNKSRFGDWTQ